MENLGNLIRTYIKRSGYNNYSIAKMAGVNRTTLQKVLTGERRPSGDFIKRLLPLLKLTPSEMDELFSLLEMAQTGKPLYMRRQFIQNMLVSASEFLYSGDTLRETKKSAGEFYSNDFFFNPSFQNGMLIPGGPGVEQLLNQLIQKECLSSHPEMLVNAPGNAELLKRLFTHTVQYCRGSRRLKVTQLVCFLKDMSTCDSPTANLDCLSHILPFAAISDFQYCVHYYYGHYILMDAARSAFPYYIVFSDTLVLLSADLCMALPFRDNSMVYHFKNHFEAALTNTTPLITECSGIEEILTLLIRLDEGGTTLYSIEYQPCFPAYLTEELIHSCVKPEMPGRRQAIDRLLYRVHQLENMETHTCIFSKNGLMNFSKTGILADFPPEYVLPIPPAGRKYLMEELYLEIKTDRQQHRMVNPILFPITDHLTCGLHPNRGIEFWGFATGSGNYIHLTEQTLLEAFSDFFHYLSFTPYVYSKDDTLNFIRQCIDSLEI